MFHQPKKKKKDNIWKVKAKLNFLKKKVRNQIDLICELPATAQHAKYLAKYIKENNFKIMSTYIYICIIHILHI